VLFSAARIEVDGGQHGHDAGRRSDAARDAYLRRQGFKALRFWNNEVLENLEGVTIRLYETLGIDSVDPHPNPSPQGGGA
jgi:very-short-patch-repair endonuclease